MNRDSATCRQLSAYLMLLCLCPPLIAEPPADLSLSPVTSLGANTVALRQVNDGSGRLFLVEQSGRIRIFDGASLLTTPFLDIQSLVKSGGEQGLLGLAFHPNYPTNGYFFLNYTYDPGPGLDRTRIVRYRVSPGDPNLADPGSATNILEIAQDFSNHNGGDIHFGPDGYLYIGMGDGGSGGDPNDRARDLTSLLGKMLRIDVDGPPAGSGNLCGLVNNYSVPADNPFHGNDPANACDEIWSYGLRNPWRWSFDRDTGDLLIGDVGQNAWEEINFQPADSPGGEFYGWSCMEADTVFNASRCDGTPLSPPILSYPHSEGCSVTGGYRYRGSIPGLYGTYVYGDYCSTTIWFANRAGNTWTSTAWQDSLLDIASFGEDAAGNLYVISLDGGIFRFDSATATQCIGDSLDLSGQTVNDTEQLNCIGHVEIIADSFQVLTGGEAWLLSPGITLGAGSSVQIDATLRISN